MRKKDVLKEHFKEGTIYRRNELLAFSNSIDRHLAQLVSDGVLKKVGAGLYMSPEKGKWGEVPPAHDELVRSFLKDERFLIVSFNSYNSLGLGTTQLYNHTIVYNHKRHGKFTLGKREFDFRMKPSFPEKITKENLLVDMLNNINELAEDQDMILRNLEKKFETFRQSKVEEAARLYGKVRTKKIIKELIDAKKLSSSRQRV